MADNTVQTGSDTIRTLDRSGVKSPIQGIDVAQSGAAELLGLSYPDLAVVASAGLTTATTAYVTGDVLGSEMTFTVARASGRGSVITSAFLVDAAKVVGICDLFLFDRASTPAADNAANSWADADAAHSLGRIGFETPVVSALNNFAVATSGLPVVVKGNAATTIKGVLVTRSGHTFFGAVGDLTVVLGFEPG